MRSNNYYCDKSASDSSVATPQNHLDYLFYVAHGHYEFQIQTALFFIKSILQRVVFFFVLVFVNTVVTLPYEPL